MKTSRILTAVTAVAMALGLSSCADMLWSVGTDVSVGTPYYGYNSGIWNDAVNGFYGPLWTAPAPPPSRPPMRPQWNGGNPGPVVPPQSNGANRPVVLPSKPADNNQGVTAAPPTNPNGGQRPGNNGRP